jgi:LmbE family N-acetylglucosaminyl deacetylase
VSRIEPAARAAARRTVAGAHEAIGSLLNRGFSTALAPDPAGSAMVLSPHLDDAVLNCWSILGGAGPVEVVNVFAQPPRHGFVTQYDRICGARDSAAHMHQRLVEDAEALGLADRTPINLSFLDRQYRRFRRPPSLREMDAALRRAVPRVSALYAPAALGFEPQPDHALVRRLALQAAGQGIPVHLYADVPYACTFGWPNWVSGVPAEPHLDVDAYWQRLVREVPAVGRLRDAVVVRLTDEQAESKLAAMRAYRTQFPALDAGAIGVLSNPEIHRFEVLWGVRH